MTKQPHDFPDAACSMRKSCCRGGKLFNEGLPQTLIITASPTANP
jgi:hypothetical protein